MRNKLVQTYSNIKHRCNNTKDKKYKYYGGKGIKCQITYLQLCDLWTRDNAKKMKQPSIDRKDSSKNYTFENCRFIEMSKNREYRTTKTITSVKKSKTTKMPKTSTEPKYMHLINLTAQDEINLTTARARYKVIDIVQLGIKTALETMPQPPVEIVKKVKELIK